MELQTWIIQWDKIIPGNFNCTIVEKNYEVGGLYQFIFSKSTEEPHDFSNGYGTNN